MYNRYIPQPDGTYKRRSVHDTVPIVQPQRADPGTTGRQSPEPMQECIPSRESPRPPEPRKPRPTNHHRPDKSAASFLRELLPRDLDTGDLLIVILLLLMSADSTGDDQTNALLTLALYLFM